MTEVRGEEIPKGKKENKKEGITVACEKAIVMIATRS